MVREEGKIMRDRTSEEVRRGRRRRGRRGEYREDCTDGRFSVLNPVRFKGDVLVQVWMDSRELATVSEWLNREGNYTRFLSEVVKDGIHELVEELVDNGEVKMVDDTAEARYRLEMRYRVNLNPLGRGEKNKLHNIILSERKDEEVGRRIGKIGKSRAEIAELTRIALETYSKIEKGGKDHGTEDSGKDKDDSKGTEGEDGRDRAEG